jgi:hypothetical protein
MFHIDFLSRPGVPYAALAAIVGGVALVALLVQGQLLAAGALVLVVALVALAPLLRSVDQRNGHTTSTAEPAPTYDPIGDDSDNAPMVEQHIITSNGDTQRAWVVPMEHMGEHQLVLTREGYKLVDGTGRAVYKV